MGEISLPSAGEALMMAHERLVNGDPDAADTWIFLARELREGSRPTRPFVLGDNVPDDVASAIAQLANEVETWKSRAQTMRSEAARWQGAYESASSQLTALVAAGVKLDPVHEDVPDYGTTYGGEPAYLADPPATGADAPVSAPVYAAAREQFLAAGMSTAQPDAEALKAAVTEATQAVPTDVLEAARRLRLNDTRVAVPAERPTSPLPELRNGVCPSCQGETYEAVTADGRQTRHRETGTAMCPVR